MTYVQLICQFVLTGVFGTAVWGKLRSRRLADGVSGFRIVPERAAAGVGLVSVGAELATTALLLIPATERLGFLLAAVLLASFTAALVQAIARGLHIPCQCFGASALPIGPRHVVRNVLLGAAAAIGAARSKAGYDTAPAGIALAVGTAVVLVLLVRHLDDLTDLFGAL